MVDKQLYRTLFVLTIFSFIVGTGFWVANYQMESREAIVFQQEIETLKDEVLELERMVLELEIIFCDGPEIDRPEILRKASGKLTQVETLIDAFEEKWGDTSTELWKVKGELSSCKSNIISHYGKELDYFQSDRSRLFEIVDSLLSVD